MLWGCLTEAAAAVPQSTAPWQSVLPPPHRKGGSVTQLTALALALPGLETGAPPPPLAAVCCGEGVPGRGKAGVASSQMLSSD